jgi:dTDP-4-amino-4,6-dideoxygalactose transaminase
MTNPDIPNDLINPTGSHTPQLGTSSNLVGGRRRRTKLMRRHKRKHTKKYKSRRFTFDNTNNIVSRLGRLPLYYDLRREEIEKIVEVTMGTLEK